MSSESYQLGYQAEAWVCERLTAQGWRILQRNFRGRTGEIDIIARDGPCWVFAEVKASLRRPPVEALSARQILRIRRAASEYLQKNPAGWDAPVRFDVFWVWNQPPEWQHCPDAF